jgi:SET domain-containing protein
MKKGQARRTMFSASPVQFREQSLAGRGVFARKRFEPGELIVAFAPKQQRVPRDAPEVPAITEGKLTLLSDDDWVIVPDTSVPGGWLCNHSCNPNATLRSVGEGEVRCLRSILPGEEVTVFYGWVTLNQPGHDPCSCGSPDCRGTINFDVSDRDARYLTDEAAEGNAVRARLEEYGRYLASIGQEHVLETIADALWTLRGRNGC